MRGCVDNQEGADDAVAYVEFHLLLNAVSIVLPFFLLALDFLQNLVPPAEHLFEHFDLPRVLFQFFVLLL